MIQNYGKILELLIPRTKRIVLLTVPPVHKMSDSIQHWKVSEEFNKFILAQHNGISNGTPEIVFIATFNFRGTSIRPRHWKALDWLLWSNNVSRILRRVSSFSLFSSRLQVFRFRTFNGTRQDLMHLNRKGFLMLKFLLDLHYFGIKNY